MSATLGEVLVQKARHHSYQGYLLHQIKYIMSLSSPFGDSIPSHISRSGYTPALALAPAPAHLLSQPNHPFLRGDKVEAIRELELGLELELVCKLTLKDVKILKHQRGKKGS